MHWRSSAIVASLVTVAGCSKAPATESTAAVTPAPVAAVTGPVTYAKDVAPIMFSNCVTCHRPGQVAPFALLTYEDARKRAKTIADVTGAREMPPWLPDPGAHPIENERRLRPEQIAVLRAWADTGASEGNVADLPRPPSWPDGWQLGQPDLVVKSPRPYALRPSTDDHYRQLVYPLALPAGRFVRAVEFRPGSARVHHAVIRIDRTHESRRKDGKDGQPGFEGVMAPDVRNPEGQFVGWSPGRGPVLSPKGMPWRLDRGVDLVVELHMIAGTAAAEVQPTIGLYFTDEPPVASPVELTMGVMTLDIPAGERAYRVSQEIAMPVEVSLLAVSPHAHYLGHEMLVTATRPDGSVDQLITIKHWDFHWQQEYRFVTPVTLPQGTKLTMTYSFDNSAENEDNPSSPPRRVQYGLQSSDEMANLALQVLPRSKADGRVLANAFEGRHLQEVMVAAERRAKEEPGSPERLWELGKSYVEAGRMAEAIAPLESAIRANASFARAHGYLGRALFVQGRRAEALDHLQRAVTLDPGDELLHFDLGKVLADTGQPAEAIRSFDRVLAINPEHGQAYEGRGVAFIRLGRFADAVKSFERAVALMPDSASVENGLAVALAQAGRRAEALAHVRRALDIDPGYVPARDNLARMQRGG